MPLVETLNFICKPNLNIFESNNPFDGTLQRFFSRCPIVWEDFGDLLFSELSSYRDKERGVLVSDEGCLVEDHDPFLVSHHLENIAKMAKKWGFSEVKVIVTIRRQDTKMASSYAQISDRIEKASQENFEEYINKRLDLSSHNYTKGAMMYYDTIYKKIADPVGCDNVLVIPYETMKENVSKFIQIWFNFLGIPKEEMRGVLEKVVSGEISQAKNERSVSQNEWRLRERSFENVQTSQSWAGRLLHGIGILNQLLVPRPSRSREGTIRVSPRLTERVLKVYAESNRALDDMINIDLSAHGYY